MRTLIAAVAVGLLVVALPSAQKVDVTGKWDLTVNTDQGTRPGTLTFSSKGNALAASISTPEGDIPVDVSLKDKAITLSFSVQTQNGPIDISMTGTVDGDLMSGDLSMGDRGSATWSAKRAATQSGQKPPSEQKPAPTMTGTWQLETQHSAGTSTPTVTITQTGEKLTGKYVGSYGESELTGSIKDNKEFTFTVEIGTEQKVKVVYTGTLDGDTIRGAMTMGEMGEGTFTGKRK